MYENGIYKNPLKIQFNSEKIEINTYVLTYTNVAHIIYNNVFRSE